MTIRALAWAPTGGGTDFAAGNYNINYSYAVTDGTSDLAGGSFAQVPMALSQKKADKFLRGAVADRILLDHSIVIDPDDIYFPHP